MATSSTSSRADAASDKTTSPKPIGYVLKGREWPNQVYYPASHRPTDIENWIPVFDHAKPACAHSFHFFGDQVTVRRCVRCDELEVKPKPQRKARPTRYPSVGFTAGDHQDDVE